VKPRRNIPYDRVRTVPNALSAARVLLALAAAVLFLLWGPHLLPVFMCVAASLLDLLDGWLARRMGQVTRLGEHLDPLADKILMTVIFLALAWFLRSRLVTAMVALLLLREWGITWLREHFQRRTGQSLPADQLGKWKMLAQALFGNVFLFWLSFMTDPRVHGDFYLGALSGALALILFLSFFSAIRYLLLFRSTPSRSS